LCRPLLTRRIRCRGLQSTKRGDQHAKWFGNFLDAVAASRLCLPCRRSQPLPGTGGGVSGGRDRRDPFIDRLECWPGRSAPRGSSAARQQTILGCMFATTMRCKHTTWPMTISCVYRQSGRVRTGSCLREFCVELMHRFRAHCLSALVPNTDPHRRKPNHTHNTAHTFSHYAPKTHINHSLPSCK
jgi:hypothetical protein